MKKYLLLFAGFLLVVAVFAWYVSKNQAVTLEGTAPEVIIPTTTVTPTPTETTPPVAETPPETNTSPITSILSNVDIDVPFTAQAPTANWDAFHEEACEEASAIMAWHYFNQTKITSTNQVEDEMAAAAKWERENLGTDVSIPAVDMVEMLRQHFKLDASLSSEVTSEAFKRSLSAGNLIILPAQGQFLHNPNFKQPGPRYHMLVVRGYTANGRFITNDPGTRRGEKYQYDPKVLLDAIHDWNGGDVENGAKTAIIISGVLK